MLYRYDVLTNPASGSRVSGKGDDGRTQEGGAQGGGRDGQRRNPLDAERRSTLLKVLMICEANIFGELEDEGEVHRQTQPALLLFPKYIHVSPADACTPFTIDRAMNVNAFPIAQGL